MIDKIFSPLGIFSYVRKLDLYVLKSFLFVLLVSVFSLTGLYIVIHFFTNIGDFIEISQQNLFTFIIWYYLIRIPLILSKLLPIMALIAVMMTVLRLSKTKELVAMLSSGMSIWRTVLPIFITLCLLIGLMYYFDNDLIPRISKHISLSEKILKSEGSDKFLVRQVPNYQFIVKVYNYTRQQMHDIWINQYDQDNNLIAQITAQKGVWTEKFVYSSGGTSTRQQGWLLSNGIVYHYDSKGYRTNIPQEFKENSYLVSCNLTPQSIEKLEDTSSYMTLAKLNSLISNQPENNNLKVQFYSKLTAPIIILILVLIGMPFAIVDKSQNFFSGIGVCLLISLGFFVVKFLFENMGNKGIIPAFWGVVLPLLLFITIGIMFSKKIRT